MMLCYVDPKNPNMSSRHHVSHSRGNAIFSDQIGISILHFSFEKVASIHHVFRDSYELAQWVCLQKLMVGQHPATTNRLRLVVYPNSICCIESTSLGFFQRTFWRFLVLCPIGFWFMFGMSLREVFIMWIQMKEKAPFRVVEMGAGGAIFNGKKKQ